MKALPSLWLTSFGLLGALCASCSAPPGSEPIGSITQAVCEDNNPCTANSSFMGVCFYPALPAGTACSDGNACTVSDQCNGSGSCVGTTRVCNDNNTCTTDGCNYFSGCTFTNKTAGTSCSDGSACTYADVCNGSGVCRGSPVVCTDGNQCTTDTCNPSTGCAHTNSAYGTTCNDSNACTSSDHCNGSGSCVGTTISCADSNPCTDDGCNPASGCTHTNSSTATSCNDGIACTISDHCNGIGGCTGGGSLVCNDGNSCTYDTCHSATGCVFIDLDPGVGCNDGNACTTADVCDESGFCTGSAVNCDDANPCTIDGCNAGSGCTHTPAPSNTSCNDQNVCTTTDHCDGAGTCIGEGTLSCDDANLCTNDQCSPSSGCVHTAVSCDDSSLCTTDTCNPATGCQHTPITCDDGNECTGDYCWPNVGCSFEDEPSGLGCNDSNACTTADACNGLGTCVGSAIACNDGNDCTTDTCNTSTGCVYTNKTAGVSCNDQSVCSTADHCDGAGACLGTAIDCDDGDPCTTDGCNAGSGCTHSPAPSNTSCNDENVCTTSDHCDGAGTCIGGGTLNCSDGNACTNDVCSPSTGCSHPAVSCDDANLCTTDSCNPSTGCQHGTITCDDLNDCTTNDCQPSVGCVFEDEPAGLLCDDGNRCTIDDQCNSYGVCTGPARSCTDGNDCTYDNCEPSTGCVFPNKLAGTGCNDASLCTSGDVCNGAGVCAGTAVSCSDSNACTADSCEASVGCRHQAISCDDSSVCTIDGCDTATGCTHQAVSCDDSNVCTDDSCDGVQGCQHAVAAGRTCSDGNVCTAPDACGSGGLCSGPAYVEDDDNPCTIDTCTPGVGMDHQPTARGTSCGDGDPDNGDELCNGLGTCAPGVSSMPVATSDANALERRIDGRHPVAASSEAYAVAFSEPVHGDGSGPRVGVAVRSAVGELRGVAWIDDVTMTPHASVAALADGSFVVVFESLAIDDDGLGIGAVRVSAQGAVLGTRQLVNATTAYSQHAPDVVATSTGVVVAWEDESQDDMRRICWQKLNGQLALVGGQQCDGQPGAYDGFVTLAAVSTHTAMAWQRELDATGTLEVRIDNNKVSLALSSDAGPLPAGEPPGLTALDSNTLLVAYTDGDGVVTGSVFDDLGVELDAVQLATPGQSRTQLSAAGKYLVWREPAELADGGWDDRLDEVYVQQLDWSSGVLDATLYLKQPVPRTEADRAGDQASPALAPLAVTSNSALVIVWQDLQANVAGRCRHGDVLVSLEPLPIP